MKFKQKSITVEKYNEIMNKITRKNLPVADTLIKLLEEASKYKIIKSK